jgi:hypothetical protein
MRSDDVGEEIISRPLPSHSSIELHVWSVVSLIFSDVEVFLEAR